MDRREVQRRLVASETFCFSGARDFPKVYETFTRHHVEPDTSSSQSVTPQALDSIDDGYQVTLDRSTGQIQVSPFPER